MPVAVAPETGVVLVEVVVTTVVDVMATVPVTSVMVGVDGVGFWVVVEVGGTRVKVGILVAVITIAVLLGAIVGVGMDSTVCATCAATVP